MNGKELLAGSRALLLDFDGPVCSVFAGVPAWWVAAQLRKLLAQGSCLNLPDRVTVAVDPFEVLRYAVTLGDNIGQRIESAFAAYEFEAIFAATQAPGSHKLLRQWNDSGRPIAIVSNNSMAAIFAYLEIHGLSNFVDFISARSGPDVSLLKPNKYLLEQAITLLGASSSECALIGDSIADVRAAQAVGVKVIGYANKPEKRAVFTALCADVVVDTLDNLL